jgi:hypothetical protein
MGCGLAGNLGHPEFELNKAFLERINFTHPSGTDAGLPAFA